MSGGGLIPSGKDYILSGGWAKDWDGGTAGFHAIPVFGDAKLLYDQDSYDIPITINCIRSGARVTSNTWATGYFDVHVKNNNGNRYRISAGQTGEFEKDQTDQETHIDAGDNIDCNKTKGSYTSGLLTISYYYLWEVV